MFLSRAVQLYRKGCACDCGPGRHHLRALGIWAILRASNSECLEPPHPLVDIATSLLEEIEDLNTEGNTGALDQRRELERRQRRTIAK